MNDWDRDNLNFILKCDDNTFDEWMNSVGDDDIQYALELIHTARTENVLKQLEIQDVVEDTSHAKNILERIKNASKNL